MIRWKTVPWVLGVALLAVSLVAARRLLNTDPVTPGGAGGPAAVASPQPVGGLTVVGTVDSVPSVLTINPPGVVGMPALTISKVLVSQGQTVTPGEVLIEFDASAFVDKKTLAEHELIRAEWAASLAAKKKDDLPKELELQKLAVEKAEDDLTTAKQFRDVILETLNETLEVEDYAKGGRKLTEAEKEVRRRRNLDLQRAEQSVRLAEIALKAAKVTEQRLEDSASAIEAKVQEANAQVAAAKAQVAGAEAVVESFKLKALVAGTIEQITVAEGMTVSPATRTPLLHLVPNGPRVVRAEVEAEFASKIEGFLGKPVVITDEHNFSNTYPGIARRVSIAFLPKRFGSDSLVGSPTRALECTIEVTDPAPAGKPPLRPGQPVRVTFGN